MKIWERLLLQDTCIKANSIVMRKQGRMALGFLATHFLLTLSAVSPDLHNAFFHSEAGCLGQNAHHPCNSHESEEEEQQTGQCAVVLFSESSELSHASLFLPEVALVECEIPLLDFVYLVNGDGKSPFDARGPPLLG